MVRDGEECDEEKNYVFDEFCVCNCIPGWALSVKRYKRG